MASLSYFRCILLFLLGLLCASKNLPAQNNDRLGIRQENGKSEFYHTKTQQAFYPRGFNYIQLVQSPAGFYGESELFQPDSHDPVAVDDDFQRMAALGYNAVRIFVDLCRDSRCIADENGLVTEYIANIASLLQQADTYGLYVMLTANWLPDLGDYSAPAHEFCDNNGDFFGGNCLVMSSKGVELYAKFFTDFIQALKNAGAPMEAIWAYELRNEFFVEYDNLPFTKTSGLVTTANGQTYDMSSPAEKMQMGYDAVVFWANTTRDEIKAVDAAALVCSGFFTPNDPNLLREGDQRVVPFQAALEKSDLDFFDIHGYAGFHDFSLEAENYKIIGYDQKPIVLGEFGTFLPNASDEYLAAQLADHWQSAACSYGVTGFLYWTWDRHRVNVANPDDPWAGSDSGAFIAKVLSPKIKIDPCINVLNASNIALSKPTDASMEWEDFVSENVVDGNATQTPWIAGSDPPQWVEVDLQDRYDLAAIQIVVETGSNDPFFYTHEIQVKSSNSANYQIIHTFADERVNFETLTYQPENGALIKNVRFVRIFIPQAPGWAALHELRALLPEQRAAYDVPPPPILTYPRPSLDKLEGTILQWKNEKPDLAARLQIASDPGFQNILLDQDNIIDGQFDISGSNLTSPFWWRVRQRNNIGDSEWSVTGSIDPTLVSNDNPAFVEQVSIYPNPGHQVVYFKSPVILDGKVNFYSIEGKLALSADMLPESGPVDVSGLPPGIYFVQMGSGQQFYSSKFVKSGL